MIKNIIYLLLCAFIFTACVERGSVLQIEKKQHIIKEKTSDNMIKIDKQILNHHGKNTSTVEETNLFSFSENTKKTLSSIAIVLIGLMILL